MLSAVRKGRSGRNLSSRGRKFLARSSMRWRTAWRAYRAFALNGCRGWPTSASATACETALWPREIFAAAKWKIRRAAIDEVIDTDPVAACVRHIMAQDEGVVRMYRILPFCLLGSMHIGHQSAGL